MWYREGSEEREENTGRNTNRRNFPFLVRARVCVRCDSLFFFGLDFCNFFKKHCRWGGMDV